MKHCYRCQQSECEAVPFYKSMRGTCIQCYKASQKLKHQAQPANKVRTHAARPVEQQAIQWLQQQGLFALPGKVGIDVLIDGFIRVEVKGYDKSDNATFRTDGEGYRYTTTPIQQQRGLFADVVMLEGIDNHWHLFPVDYAGFYNNEGRVKSCFVYYTGHNRGYHTNGYAITINDWSYAQDNLAVIEEARLNIVYQLQHGELDMDKHFGKTRNAKSIQPVV